MPYITRRRRELLDPRVQTARQGIHEMQGAGELTYLVTRLSEQYLAEQKAGVGFAQLAEVIAALEAAKLEFYRMRVAPYEELKLAQNGAVASGYPTPPPTTPSTGVCER